jgi:hypothetical protein
MNQQQQMCCWRLGWQPAKAAVIAIMAVAIVPVHERL